MNTRIDPERRLKTQNKGKQGRIRLDTEKKALIEAHIEAKGIEVMLLYPLLTRGMTITKRRGR